MASPYNKFSEDACVICRKMFCDGSGLKPVLVTNGRDKLMECCSARGDGELFKYLSTNPTVVQVHQTCRRHYTYIPVDNLKRSFESDDYIAGPNKFLRSAGDPFDWRTNCFLCTKRAIVDNKRPKKGDNDIVESKTDQINESMQKLCSKRGDSWAFQVSGRLLTCGDLHSADAVYHRNCHRQFSRVGSVPSSGDSAHVGRPIDKDMSDIFKVLCDMLENSDCELYTVDDLIEHMRSLCEDTSKVYSFTYMKLN